MTYLYPQVAVDIDAVRAGSCSISIRSCAITGLPVINHDLRRQFFPQFIKGIAIGHRPRSPCSSTSSSARFGIRSWRCCPRRVGFIWSAGSLALARVELDLFSLFAVVTFIGIAVDYGIYVLYRSVKVRTLDINGVLTDDWARDHYLRARWRSSDSARSSTRATRPLHVFGIVSDRHR